MDDVKESSYMWTESFAANHILAADLFASRAKEIEEDYDYGDESQKSSEQLEVKQRHDSLVIYSIINSVAYLESLINEVYKHHQQQIMVFQSVKNNKTIVSKENLWISLKGTIKWRVTRLIGNLLLISIRVLKMANKNTFNKGALPYQDIKALVETRNYFVHYEIEIYQSRTDDEHIEHHIGSALQGKFELNPIVRDTAPFFPHQCLSHGAAKWAINQSKNFIQDFYERLGIRPLQTPATSHIELDHNQ